MDSTGAFSTFVVKLDSFNSVPGTRRMEGESQFPQVVL